MAGVGLVTPTTETRGLVLLALLYVPCAVVLDARRARAAGAGGGRGRRARAVGTGGGRGRWARRGEGRYGARGVLTFGAS